MDRRVKERLVGASILVVLIVLIVPELLSGPPEPAPAPVGARLPVSAPEPVRNVTVDLATSKAPEPPEAEAAASSAQPPEPRSGEAASAVAGADASAGTGTGANAVPPANATLPSDAQDSTDVRPSTTGPSTAPPRPESLETGASAPISPSAKPAMAGKAWAVQLGSFASRANADKLVRQLKAQGFSVYVVSGGSGPSMRYRVRIGPMADRGTAAQAVAKLKSAGQVASLVPPAP
jgi:DedD protein